MGRALLPFAIVLLFGCAPSLAATPESRSMPALSSSEPPTPPPVKEDKYKDYRVPRIDRTSACEPVCTPDWTACIKRCSDDRGPCRHACIAEYRICMHGCP